MMDETTNPQINISKIPIGGGIGGAFAAISMVLTILLGIPALWYLVAAAIISGCAVALGLHFARHKNPGAPWLLPGTKK
jgi:hypothetical protein